MGKRIQHYIDKWKDRCYTEDIPDIGPDDIFDKVPSYKKIALALLNNEYSLESLGAVVRKSRYYNELKKIELKEREIYKNPQLTVNDLFL